MFLLIIFKELFIFAFTDIEKELLNFNNDQIFYHSLSNWPTTGF